MFPGPLVDAVGLVEAEEEALAHLDEPTDHLEDAPALEAQALADVLLGARQVGAVVLLPGAGHRP